MEDRWLTPDQVADLIGIRTWTLARWRTKRRGPPYVRMTAGSVRYRYSALEKWMSDREVTPQPLRAVKGGANGVRRSDRA